MKVLRIILNKYSVLMCPVGAKYFPQFLQVREGKRRVLLPVCPVIQAGH